MGLHYGGQWWGINWSAPTGICGSMIRVRRVRTPRRTCAFNGGDDEPAKRAHWTQTRIDGAMLNFLLSRVPVGEDDRASAATALAAGFLGSSQRHLGRAQVIDQQKVR